MAPSPNSPSFPQCSRSTEKEKHTIPLKCDKQPLWCTLGIPGACGRNRGQGGFQGLGPYTEILCPGNFPLKHSLNCNQEAKGRGQVSQNSGSHTRAAPATPRERGAHECLLRDNTIGEDQGQRPGGWWEQMALLPAALGHGLLAHWSSGALCSASRCTQPPFSPQNTWDQVGRD